MLVVSGITKKYGRSQILKDVSLSVKAGEIVAIIGKNGCGKSTLLKIIAGVLKPDSGNITYYNRDALKDNKVFSKFAGYVPQDNPLMEELTVKDNLLFWSMSKDIDKDVLEEFDLEEILNKKVSSLSGGMKRRLSIATTVINRPPVLILDEPTSSLDLYYQKCIMDALLDIKKKDGMVLMSTHNESEILMADRVYVFDDGGLTGYDKSQLNLNEIRSRFLISDK